MSMTDIIQNVKSIPAQEFQIPQREELAALSEENGEYYNYAKGKNWPDAKLPQSFPSDAQKAGPFEVTPDLAQVRIVHSIGLKTSSQKSVDLSWASIVNRLQDPATREKILQLTPTQALPASVKIVAATVGDSKDTRNMFYVTVHDYDKKALHTAHMYRDNLDTHVVGFPLQLLTEEGGFVLEEPPQLTDTFRHYWYISQSMLTCCAYKQESATGSFIQIPKNSDAARLMWYVLITKNKGITMLNNFDSFNDNNDPTCWRFPEAIFKKVNELLGSKLKDVREKSFNLTQIKFSVQPFSVFEDYVSKKDLPVLLTVEIDIHLPLARKTDEIGAERKLLRSASANFGADDDFSDDD